MSHSLTQYIDLYDANSDIIASQCGAPVMNGRRAAARASLQDANLPRKGEEGYEKTSLDDMFAPDLGVNINRINIPVDIATSFKCDVPNVSTLLAVTVNDTFVPTATLLKNIPQGLTVMSLARAAKEQPALTERYDSLADNNRPEVAMNTMLAQDGVLIHVARGVKVDRPVQIVNIFNSPAPLAAFRRVLIVAEADSEVNILMCDHTQRHDCDYLSDQVVEICAGENARIDLYDIEESTPRTRRVNNVFVSQQAGSNVLVNGMTLLNGVTRNNYDINLDGEHCRNMLAGMAIASGTQHVDNASSMTHRAPHCKSDQLFKYALDDKAVGAFEGCIEVTPDAPYTEAYQSNRNILASADARKNR